MKEFNETQKDMLDDLDSLEEMSFDDVEIEETDKEQKEFDLASFMVDIEELLPEFNDYFKQNRYNTLEKLLDKGLIEEIQEETKYAKNNEHKNIRFESDDDVINAIFQYLSLDILSKRMDVMKDFYREHLIKIHKECSDSKTFSTPVVDIQETVTARKPSLNVRPRNAFDEMKGLSISDDFLATLPYLDWSKMTKGAYDKLLELIYSSKEDGVKNFYKELEKEGIAKMSGGNSVYKIISRLNV